MMLWSTEVLNSVIDVRGSTISRLIRDAAPRLSGIPAEPDWGAGEGNGKNVMHGGICRPWATYRDSFILDEDAAERLCLVGEPAPELDIAIGRIFKQMELDAISGTGVDAMGHPTIGPVLSNGTATEHILVKYLPRARVAGDLERRRRTVVDVPVRLFLIAKSGTMLKFSPRVTVSAFSLKDANS